MREWYVSHAFPLVSMTIVGKYEGRSKLVLKAGDTPSARSTSLPGIVSESIRNYSLNVIKIIS